MIAKRILIDCGTSYLKMCVSDKNGHFFDEEELSASTIGEKLKYISNYIENKTQKYKSDLIVAFSTEMHGFILVDKFGNELTKYYSWTDECPAQIIKEMEQIVDKKWIINSGMDLKPGIVSTNLYNLVVAADIDVENAILLTLGDYFIYKLSGTVPSMHPTNAAATGLYDIKNDIWNKDYINAVGFDKIIFPNVCEGDTVCCRIGNCNIIFLEAIGDQQAALLGAGLEDKQLSLNMGTGSQVSVLSSQLLFSNNYQTRPYFGEKYLLTVPHIPCGRALNVFKNFFVDFVSKYLGDNHHIEEDRIWELLMEGPQSKGDGEQLDIDLSFFENAISKSERGAIKNISENNFTIGNMSTSLLNIMADNYRQAVAKLPANCYKDCVVFSGGVSRKNANLRRMIMQKLDIDNEIVVNNETFGGLSKYVDMHGRL